MQKFKELAFLLSEILCHKVAPLQFDIYRLELTTIRKNRILCLIISFLALNYIPLCISLVFKKQLQQPPWRIDFPKILPKLMAKEPPPPTPHP